jgi:hypothetical protein
MYLRIPQKPKISSLPQQKRNVGGQRKNQALSERKQDFTVLNQDYVLSQKGRKCI